MAAHVNIYKISATGGSQVTLQPQTGVTSAPDLGDKLTSIVLNFNSAVPTGNGLDKTNLEVVVSIETR